MCHHINLEEARKLIRLMHSPPMTRDLHNLMELKTLPRMDRKIINFFIASVFNNQCYVILMLN